MEVKICKYCGEERKENGHHCSGKKAFEYGIKQAELIKIEEEQNGDKGDKVLVK
jgi:hypothetical protein